jgi:hypothetical protein
VSRNLLRRDLVFTFMKDMGRQRVANFVVKKFQHLSATTSQLLKEQRKNEVLTAAATSPPHKEKPQGGGKAASATKKSKTKKKEDTVESRKNDEAEDTTSLELGEEAKPEHPEVAPETAVRSVKKSAADKAMGEGSAKKRTTPPSKRKIREKWSVETTPVPKAAAAEENEEDNNKRLAVEEEEATVPAAAAIVEEEPMEVDSKIVPTPAAQSGSIAVSICSEFSFPSDRSSGGGKSPGGGGRKNTFGVSVGGPHLTSAGGEPPPTYRQLKRANMVLMAVRQHKVREQY